jgi:hypothetical protein
MSYEWRVTEHSRAVPFVVGPTKLEQMHQMIYDNVLEISDPAYINLQPPTEIITGRIFWVKRGRHVRLTSLLSVTELSTKHGNLEVYPHYKSPLPVTGIALVSTYSSYGLRGR